MRIRIRTLALAGLALCAPVAAAPPAVETGSTTVVAVEVPVAVLVDGRPLRGLSADDFELLDGRTPQRLTGFEVIDLAAAAASAAPLPAAGRRHFLLLFDLANSDPAAIGRAKVAARELVGKSLVASDLVAVGAYSRSGARLALAFTPDRGQAIAAIEGIGSPELFDRQADPLALQLADARRASEPTNEPAIVAPASRRANPDGDAEPALGDIKKEEVRDALENSAAAVDMARRQEASAQVIAFTRGFGDLAKLMSRVDGRKYVVFLSQGFESALATGGDDPDQAERDARNVESGERFRVDSEKRFGSGRVANELAAMLADFRRSDCVIETVDIGGLAAGAAEQARRGGRETLFAMAADTGGRLYENFNDLGEAMGDLLDATSVTYVLTFQPRDPASDGAYHPIAVRLRNAPRGARVVHRPGYYAPTRYADLRAVDRQLDTAQLLISGESGGTLVAGAVAACFPGAGERAHVPVVVELDGPSLIATRGGGADDKVRAAVYVYAFDRTGAVRDWVAQPLSLDLAKVEGKLLDEGLKLATDLRLPAGDYSVRVLVRAGAEGAYWLDQLAVRVPDFAAAEPRALPPLFPQPMSSGLVVRASTSAEKTRGLAYPFTLGDRSYLPTALPRVDPGAEIQAVWVAYNLGPGEPEVGGRLEDELGRELPGGAIRRIERVPGGGAGESRWLVTVAPGAAASGWYTLRLHAAQGDRVADAQARLRVGS
jgi:VWFA-related protein